MVIKADGTYKQIIKIEFAELPTIDYESEWQPWHLEQSEDKISYIHLDGMGFCGMNADISCDKRDGDGYDFCQYRSIEMVNEGVLIVLAAHGDQSPNNSEPEYYIYLHYPLGSENSWAYALQQP